MKSKPKILVVTPRLPFPPIGGDKLRIYNLCKELSKQYEISLISLHTSRRKTIDFPDEIFKEAIIVHHPKWKRHLFSLLYLFSTKPIQLGYYKSIPLKNYIKHHAHKYDAIFCHLIRTAGYSEYFEGVKLIELTDALSLTYMRSSKAEKKINLNLKSLIYKIESRRVARYEKKVVNAFDHCYVVSNIDKNHLENLNPKYKENLSVFGNGINYESFMFKSRSIKKNEIIPIIFVGMMKTLQNRDAIMWFSTHVLPIIRKKYPNIILEVHGKISAKWSNKLRSYEGVNVKGEFQDINVALKSAKIGICPMRIGAGIQNKILEYQALGIPVITSSVGFEGLICNPGSEILIANTPEQYAEQITLLVEHPEIYNNISVKARSLIEKYYSWTSQLNGFADTIDGIFNKKTHL